MARKAIYRDEDNKTKEEWEVRTLEKERKGEKQQSYVEATWLPTAIRGGDRHESHDDVTTTMATQSPKSIPRQPSAMLFFLSFPQKSSVVAGPYRSQTYRQRATMRRDGVHRARKRERGRRQKVKRETGERGRAKKKGEDLRTLLA